MEKEISSGVMLGIVLIALAAIIGLGFGIFSIAKGTANEGVVNVQDNLGQVSQSGFDDYNQKVVTGTQVKSAYNTYQGKPYSIWISTAAMNATTGGLSDPDVTIDESKYRVYNATLEKLDDDDIAYENGTYIVAKGFAIGKDKRIVYNSKIENMSKSGMAEYIPATARFEANLIKDKSGTIVGIAFRQVAS